MNVSVIDREPNFGQAATKVLSVNKDFAAGEVIYKACDLFRFKNDTNELLPNRNSLLSLLWIVTYKRREAIVANAFVPFSQRCLCTYPEIRVPVYSTWFTAPKPA